MSSLGPIPGARSAASGGLERMRRPRLYEQIAEQIVAYVGRENLSPGDRLPTERDLAAALGVSRASVSQALVALEVVGTVQVRHGDGVLLAEQPVARQLARRLARHAEQMPEIIEAREALEVSLSALAARRRTEDDLAEIDGSLQEMAADVDGGGRGVAGDERFHAAVTAAAHSSVLAGLMDEISGLIRESRIESLSQPGRPRASLAGHRRVAEAIRAQDPDSAGRAMADHIRLVSEV